MDRALYNPPRQERSRKSLEQFLDATESLIRECGYDEFNVHDVAKRAGFSVGGLYSRFPTKTSLLSAVRARFLERQRVVLSAQFETGRGLDSCLAAALERSTALVFHHFLKESPIFRAILTEESREDSTFTQGCEVGYDYRRTLFREALLACREEITHPDPEAVVDWVFALLSALIKDRLIHGEGARTAGGYSDAQLLSHLKHTALAYLTIDRTEPAAT